jgi:hypothetical protein
MSMTDVDSAKAGKIFWGSFFIIIGLLLLMSSLGIMPWSYWWRLWPLGLIFLGIAILISKNPSKKDEADERKKP